MRVATFVCSESCALDQSSNRVSIFHIMDGINATAFPVTIRGMSLYILWERDEHDPVVFQYSVRIMLGTEQLARLTAQGDFKGHTRARVIGTIQGFRLPRAGRISVVIEAGGTKLANWEIEVRSVAAQTDQTAAGQSETPVSSAPSGMPAPLEAPVAQAPAETQGAEASDEPPMPQAFAATSDTQALAEPPAVAASAEPATTEASAEQSTVEVSAEAQVVETLAVEAVAVAVPAPAGPSGTPKPLRRPAPAASASPKSPTAGKKTPAKVVRKTPSGTRRK